MATPTTGRSADEVSDVFRNSVLYEIQYAFGVPAHYQYDYCVWESVNLTRLAHARVLYKFFETPASKRQYPSDVVCEDFGFDASPNLLTKDDWDRLNKDLFHLSYDRLRHDPPEEKVWPPHLLGNLRDPVVAFMKHVRDNNAELFGNANDLQGWCNLLTIIDSGRELQIAAHFVDGHIRYSFIPGRLLPDGKPTYTAVYPVLPVSASADHLSGPSSPAE